MLCKIGACACKPGLFGNECEKTCPPGTYGLNCNSTCKCHNESRCRESDGICLCNPGFYGPTCSEGLLNIIIYYSIISILRNTIRTNNFFIEFITKISSYEFTIYLKMCAEDNYMIIS